MYCTGKGLRAKAFAHSKQQLIGDTIGNVNKTTQNTLAKQHTTQINILK